MPYADLPVTRAMQPLKLKEYLATGKPVVVRDLPATEPWADCLDVAETPEAFAAAVRRAVADRACRSRSRRARSGSTPRAGRRRPAQFERVDRWSG